MTTSLSARQGLLTKTTGRLKTLLDEISETLRTRSSEDEEVKENGSSREEHDMQNRSLQLKKLKKAVETASTSVENALQTYTAAADMLDTSTPDLSAILDKVLSNSSVAQDLLLRAQTSMVELDMALEELPMVTSASQEEETTPGATRSYTCTQIQWENMGVGEFLERFRVLSPHQKNRRHLQDELLVRFP
ncbi:hypothetical protein GCK32_000687 [Trichostrongylus colubriformis]|uniref:Uncharacterized protein n=1 Tax=Trichostrongylus colubriformis TaxID=6319 RepID=A0AAN8FVX8_TRICO